MSSQRRRLLSKDTPQGGEGDEEAGITKPLIDPAAEKKEPEYPAVTFSQLLFRYAESFDVYLVTVGTLAAIANGATMPVVMLIFGEMIQTFVQYEGGQGITNEQLMNDAQMFFIYYLCLGGFALTMGYFQFSCWMWLGERVSRKLRLDYFYSLLSQDIGWYDAHQTGDLTTRIVNDSQTVQEAMSEKTSQSFQQIATFITGFVIAFTKGWKMTLVLLAVFPVLAISGAFIAKIFSSLSTKGQAAYAEAGSVAEEVFSSIRTVAAFGGEKREVKRYKKKLTEAFKTGVSKGKVLGAGLGVTMFSLFGSYALAFWFGGRQVLAGNMDVGEVITVFFSVTIGAFALGGATPGITAIAAGTAAAARVFSVVDRVSPIDPFDRNGVRAKIEGKIEFKNVHFSYPSRPDTPILQDMSFTIPSGKTFALVGSSGCGKSTVIGLLERFYDIASGSISIDDHKITDINNRWLRSHIGLVSQEPALFAMSIRDNIALGKIENGEEPTQAEIEAAAKEANAHSFITQLPNGYNTLVGERGAQLSGGQKQRVAIARALLKKPKILLLDEATSALDSQSERVVQDALDKASKGRTTIVIAHRLSTITNADYIAVVHEGKIVELGSHNDLMANAESRYSQMVKAQAIVSADDEIELRSSSSATNQYVLKSSTSQVSSEIKAGSISTEDEKEPEYPVPISRVGELNKKEWVYLAGGLFFAAINGVTMPAFAVIFSRVSSVFIEIYTDEEKFKSDSRLWSLMFVVLGLVCGIANFFQASLFTYAGEKLTQRLRKRTFQAMLNQPIGWFDQNTTGKLTTKLANDASLVQSMVGQRLASLLQAGVSMGAGLIIAFLGGWEMTLVVLGCVPLISIAGGLHIKALTGYSQLTRVAYEKAGTISTQAIENIRTVTSLAKEKRFFELYEASIQTPYLVGVKRAHFAGFGFGISQFFIFFTYGVGFYFGAYLMTKTMTFQEMMQVFSAVVFSAMAAGQAVSLAPDYTKAKDAASSVFRILDLQSSIDSSSKDGSKPNASDGTVHLENVQFSYPTRPGVIVAKDLNLSVPVGKTVALVGPSGCGKSTIVSLLLRFYDVSAGKVFYDKSEVRSLNIEWLRQQAGVVSQEPILFATTIKENIAYGKKGKAKQGEIEEAARAANIHDFVSSLPEGYDTYVGEKGTQLSGGQKQRIAIARALIRNPKVLLLDEATSALDTESERVVQAALDAASVGRTTIIIAHRLSTIQRADSIAVVNEGQISELGTHAELLEKGGLYAKLVKQQQKKH